MQKAAAFMFVVALALVAPSGVVAQKPSPTPAPGVLGKWSLEAETPHGKMTIALELTIDAKDPKKITGTMANDMMGNLPLAGEYVDSKLTFKATGGGGEMTFAGKLKDAKTLTGVLSSPSGDIAVVATRVVEK